MIIGEPPAVRLTVTRARTAQDDCIPTSVNMSLCQNTIGDAISATSDEWCLGGLAEWPSLVLAVTRQMLIPEYLPYDGPRAKITGGRSSGVFEDRHGSPK